MKDILCIAATVSGRWGIIKDRYTFIWGLWSEPLLPRTTSHPILQGIPGAFLPAERGRKNKRDHHSVPSPLQVSLSLAHPFSVPFVSMKPPMVGSICLKIALLKDPIFSEFHETSAEQFPMTVFGH